MEIMNESADMYEKEQNANICKKTLRRMYQEAVTKSNDCGYGEQRHRQPRKIGKEGGIKVLASLGTEHHSYTVGLRRT